MRSIGLINWKGGVGKTTISINLAYALAQHFGHLKVLFIDVDKQGNASSWFDADFSKPTLTDILVDGMRAEDVIRHTRYENIDLIPGNSELLDASLSVLKEQTRRQDNILKQALEPVKNQYDLCIFDYPPDSNIAVLNALECTDDIIAVADPNPFALQGIRKLQQDIDNYNKVLNLGFKIRGVVINRRTTESTEAFEELKKDYYMFPFIRESTNTKKWLDRVVREHKSIYEIAPNTGFARDLKQFMNKLMEVIECVMTGKSYL